MDAGDGSARRLTTAGTAISDPAWSPDGARIAFSTDRRPDRDQMWHQQIYVVDAESGQETRVTDAGHTYFGIPTWLPDGRTLAVVGHRFPARAGSRNDIWLFAADGSEADRGAGRNLSGRHDLMVAAGMGSDLTPGEDPRIAVTAGGRWITFSAPYGGSYELWRISTENGDVIRLYRGQALHLGAAVSLHPDVRSGHVAPFVPNGATVDLVNRTRFRSPARAAPDRARSLRGRRALQQAPEQRDAPPRAALLLRHVGHQGVVDGRALHGRSLAPSPRVAARPRARADGRELLPARVLRGASIPTAASRPALSHGRPRARAAHHGDRRRRRAHRPRRARGRSKIRHHHRRRRHVHALS